MPSATARSRCWCSTSPTRWCPSRWPTSASASARCWWWRKASPNTSSRRSPPCCAGATSRRRLHGKDLLPMGGEYTRGGAGAGPAGVRRRYLPAAGADRPALAGRPTARAARPRRSARPAAAGAAAGLLHRLPRAAGVLGAQAGAAADRPGAHRGRHRLPCLRHLRALLHRPLDPGLRHEPGQPRRRLADDAAAHAGHHGRRRLLAQRPAHRRAERPVQRRRRGAADLQERLHLGHRHAGDHLHAATRTPRKVAAPTRRRAWCTPTRPSRTTLQGPGREVAAHRAHLRGRGDAPHARSRPSPPTSTA